MRGCANGWSHCPASTGAMDTVCCMQNWLGRDKMAEYYEILVKNETKKVFNALAKYLGMTHDELVKRMIIEFVELNNLTEFFLMIEQLRDKD